MYNRNTDGCIQHSHIQADITRDICMSKQGKYESLTHLVSSKLFKYIYEHLQMYVQFAKLIEMELSLE